MFVTVTQMKLLTVIPASFFWGHLTRKTWKRFKQIDSYRLGYHEPSSIDKWSGGIELHLDNVTLDFASSWKL